MMMMKSNSINIQQSTKEMQYLLHYYIESMKTNKAAKLSLLSRKVFVSDSNHFNHKFIQIS